MALRITQAATRRFATQGAAILRQQPARRCSTMNIAGEKKLTDWEKRIMVWGGAFKSRAEVPCEVPHNMYQKCQERFRIKMNLYTIAVCLLACTGAMVASWQNEDSEVSLHDAAMKRHNDAAAAAKGGN